MNTRFRDHSNRMTNPIHEELSVIDPQWETLDPKPDINALYKEFNVKFFRGKMSGFALETSTGKMKIRLNKPLLDLRPKRTTVEILLHEMIHIHQFSSKSRDRSHGPTFHYHKRRINRLTGANIMAYPDFKDEYDLLKCHWWECNGPCGELVTRIMNRPPATKAHKRKCGGEFIKISESEDGPSNKRRKV
ncbi:hypothetical protein XELAEV_18015175mg [Xenopus laevis]|uniref:SprT-like domain-containing protein n=1 Tax=Xenopus laevis TaxID=8355 RepID=A0A974HVY1_XENLA|nr:hypothetical protein XELAEV_18015175mg [Xenopus laevis]